MIYIPAKLKCDSCEATVDVVLEMRKSDHNIPDLTIEDVPEGWGWAGWDSRNYHHCPKHK